MTDKRTRILGVSRTDGLVCRPITTPGDVAALTSRRTTDARTALARGLGEYLGQQSIIWEGGRQLYFRSVQVVWAEPEVPAEFPAIAVISSGEAAYDPSQFVPQTEKLIDGSNRYVRSVSEMVQAFQVIVWTTDPEARMGLSAVVEDAMNPADFMTGLRLELPYYFNSRATYELMSVFYQDSETTTRARERHAVFTITGKVPQYRMVGELPSMRVSLDLEVE